MQQVFHKITNISAKYRNCFSTFKPFDQQSEEWKSFFFSDVNKAFKKIRITNKVKKSEVVELMEKRSELKQKLKVFDSDKQQSIEQEIDELEIRISNLSSKENYERLRIHFRVLVKWMDPLVLMECGN